MIPGDTSTTLWTETHPYQDLPRVLDPVAGCRMQMTTLDNYVPTGARSDDYPPYMAPRGPMNFRAQRSAQMLSEDEQLSKK